MLPDKMAISHSNHLFVPVALVFCCLTPLIHASDSYDYTDSRQFEKKLAVPRHSGNIQRLPNYNWKPPDKYYGPRETLAERNMGTEFTKPEDSERRMADPRIKKMQEISRQEREKWAARKRSVKLTPDNVEETTKAGKLTNNESITALFKESISRKENATESHEIKTPVRTIHRRHKDYEIFDVKESPFFKENTDRGKSERDLKKTNSHPERILPQIKDPRVLKSNKSTRKYLAKSSANEKNLNSTNGVKEFRLKNYLTFILSQKKKKSGRDVKKDDASLHPKSLILQQLKIPYVPRTSLNKKSKNVSASRRNLNDNADSKPPAKEYPKQFSLPQNDNEAANGNTEERYYEKTTTANSLTRKSKVEKHNAARKDAADKPNHKRSFHRGRWGMSVSSPPLEFLRDMSRRSMHRKSEERIERDGKRHLFGRQSMRVASPAKEFFEKADSSAAKIRSRSGEIAGSPGGQSSIRQSQNLQAAPVQRLMSDVHKEPAETSPGKVSDDRDSGSSNSNYLNNYYPASADFNNGLSLGFLLALGLHMRESVIDIPMTCRIRLSHPPFPRLKNIL
ncbi:hypothetical protein PUN28_017263 [Cardiocondyla obscurior]|uniref:Uncharacterized protein n=1 Tax=Cardiocondyla obscurior TaxID=286306 RepID=A0AAW2ERV7_9HYME